MNVLNPKYHAEKIVEWLEYQKSSLNFFTPFFTMQGFKILPRSILEHPHLNLLVRGRPEDYTSGAIECNALKRALDAGWTVRFNGRLHAKAFWNAEHEGFWGSANLTGKGLSLASNGNFEIVSFGILSSAWLEDAYSLWDVSKTITYAYLDEISHYLSTHPPIRHDFPDFPTPTEPVKIKKKGFTLLDLPQSHSLLSIAVKAQDKYELENNAVLRHDIKLLSLSGKVTKQDVYNKFKALPIVEEFLKYVGDGRRFGDLRAWLKRKIMDVPTPSTEDYNTQLNKLFSFVVEAHGGKYIKHVPGKRSEFLIKLN